MIRLDGVEVAFEGLTVLDGIDLTVGRGEFVGLVGPNGAGKTTLLRTINGILTPDAGSVRLDESPVGGMDAKAISRRLATVPQDTHVGFPFSAEQIVEMGRTPHRSRLDWSDDADPVDWAMERTDTTPFRDRNVDDLSGGERQRILLARAIAQEPDGLLLDEPTASLDVNHQIRVLGLVEALVSEGRAALAAIHDLDLAARFCDRLVLLHGGEIRARGTPESVLNDGRLASAFDTATAVTENPATGTPMVTALSETNDRSGRVHVAGGGASATRAVRTLWRAGFEVTLGPAPEGDRAVALARELDVPAVTAPAFDGPGEEERRRVRNLADRADVVVRTDGPADDVYQATDGTARVRATLDGGTTDVARLDGGEPNAVENSTELIRVVADLCDG